MYEKDKKEVTDKLIDKLSFRIKVLFGSNSKFGVFDKKIETLFDEIFPDLEALSWISLDHFGDFSTMMLEYIFKNYKDDLRYMYDNQQGADIVSYHEKLGAMYIKKYREYEAGKNESMLKIMRYFAEDHDNSLRIVAQEKKQGGCYIATLAYGDYNHPQVIQLRKFRDNHLQRTFLGSEFVKIYYLISPKIVSLLKDSKFIIKISRIMLDFFINKYLNKSL